MSQLPKIMFVGRYTEKKPYKVSAAFRIHSLTLENNEIDMLFFMYHSFHSIYPSLAGEDYADARPHQYSG